MGSDELEITLAELCGQSLSRREFFHREYMGV